MPVDVISEYDQEGHNHTLMQANPRHSEEGSNNNKSHISSVTLKMTPVYFYPSINGMWINLFVFQMPDGNRFAKEVGLVCGFI